MCRPALSNYSPLAVETAVINKQTNKPQESARGGGANSLVGKHKIC